MTTTIGDGEAMILIAGMALVGMLFWCCFRIAMPAARQRGTDQAGLLRTVASALAVVGFLHAIELWTDYSERSKGDEVVNEGLEHMRERCLGLINKRTSEPHYRPPSRTERYVCEKFPELVGQRALMGQIEKLR
jgi:hypothetical protein